MTPKPRPIIPPDPPPPPPHKETPSMPPQEDNESGETPRKSQRPPAPGRGDRREIPRRPTPPAIIGRLLHDLSVHDSRGTPSVGSGGPGGFDLIHIGDHR